MKNLSYRDTAERAAPPSLGTLRPEAPGPALPEEPGVAVTRKQIADYLENLLARGCVDGSVKKYRRDLAMFYDFLPDGKEITRSTLEEWRAELLAHGYAPRTVNAALSEANSFLGWLGRREFQLPQQLEITDDVQPELTRTEYLRLLSTARALGMERAYLLVKTAASTGITVQELPQLTVEAVRHNQLYTAICKNIQHSQDCYEDGGDFRHLYSLCEAGELTSAINRIIEDMNHRFLIPALMEDFTSRGLRLTAAALRKERDPKKRTDVLDIIDTEAVTRSRMELLDIRNQEEQSTGITQAHINEIKEYLTVLELIVNCPVETAGPNTQTVEHILFTQPWMRYCRAQALVHALMKGETFAADSEREKTQVTERIPEEVRGRMMEDSVLLETMKAADKHHHAWKRKIAYEIKNNGCPFCNGRLPTKETSLAGARPDLALEWHPSKSLPLSARDVTLKGSRRVWWKCQKGHEWQMNINTRVSGIGNCPYCMGKRVCEENALATLSPRIAEQWHPEKNGALPPDQVTNHSSREATSGRR